MVEDEYSSNIPKLYVFTPCSFLCLLPSSPLIMLPPTWRNLKCYASVVRVRAIVMLKYGYLLRLQRNVSICYYSIRSSLYSCSVCAARGGGGRWQDRAYEWTRKEKNYFLWRGAAILLLWSMCAINSTCLRVVCIMKQSSRCFERYSMGQGRFIYH